MDKRNGPGFTHVVAPPDCGMAALEVFLALSLGAGRRALTQIEAVVAELIQGLVCCSRHGVCSEAEDIAVGVGSWDCIRHPCGGSIELFNIRPDVFGVVGVDVVNDFVGSSCDVDPVGGTRNVELPGHVNNGVQDHLAMNVGGKESAVVKDSGGVLGDKLVQIWVSSYFSADMVDNHRLMLVAVCVWICLLGTYICIAGFHQQTQEDHDGHLERQADEPHGR